jgi:CheY-like chemotaxis protein
MKKLNCILLVEDNPLTILLSEKLIEALDITEHLQVAQNGKAALEYLNRKTRLFSAKPPVPDIILLDLNMPVMDGWQFLNAFERLPQDGAGAIPVVVLSTSPNPDDISRAKAYKSVVDYKHKPLTQEMIDALIADHLPDFA